MERQEQDPEGLVPRMREEFEACMRRVMEAVNASPDGAWIEGSEVEVHELMRRFETRVYEAALQARIDAAEPAAARSRAAFSPGGPRRPRVRTRAGA